MQISRLSPLRRTLLAGGTAVLIGGSAIGVVAAQQTPTPTPTTPPGLEQRLERHQALHQSLLEEVAQRLGVTTAALEQAFSEARQELGLPDRAGLNKPFGGERHGPGRPGFAFVRGLSHGIAAQAIGITPQELRQEVMAGQSVAQVAQAHGVDPSVVVAALTDAANQRIDAAVANGRLTTEQAEEQKARVAERVQQMVEQVKPMRGPGERRGAPSGEDQGA